MRSPWVPYIRNMFLILVISCYIRKPLINELYEQ